MNKATQKQLKNFKYELDTLILKWWSQIDFEAEPEIIEKVDQRSLSDRQLERIFRDLSQVTQDLERMLVSEA